MREAFTCFYPHTNDDLKELSKKATIVCDANVLLNLYRFPKKSTDDLFKILDQLKERLWIPHQVGLEYQRNRMKVILDQKKKFDEVKKVVKQNLASLRTDLESTQVKERHATIEIEPFLNEVGSAAKKLFENLQKLDEDQTDVNGDDLLREKIDQLFEGRVGGQFSADDLSNTSKEGDERYKNQIPPGYRDSEKRGSFYYDGGRYEQKFGDLILWKQLLRHVKNDGIKHVILVTDDDKEDWWEIVGGKTIGPRFELIREIQEHGVQVFKMYKSEQFLRWAPEFLNVQIDPESANNVEEYKERFEELERLKTVLPFTVGPSETIQTYLRSLRVMSEKKIAELTENSKTTPEFSNLARNTVLTLKSYSNSQRQREIERLVNSCSNLELGYLIAEFTEHGMDQEAGMIIRLLSSDREES